MKLEITKVKDESENYYTKKDLLGDLPFRCLIVGKSQLSGKTNLVINLLCKDEFYNKDFLGKNIFIISKSIKNDPKISKLIMFKKIPSQNLMEEFDEEYIEALYELVEEEHEKNIEEKKKVNYLFLYDDISFGGDLKKNYGVISKTFSNGRHSNISCILTSQKFTDILTSARENASMSFFFACSDKQLESINNDFNYLGNKKLFKKIFRKTTENKHSFLFVNFSNPAGLMYLDSKFQPVKIPQTLKHEIEEKEEDRDQKPNN